jgi:hypothetical protein
MARMSAKRAQLGGDIDAFVIAEPLVLQAVPEGEEPQRRLRDADARGDIEEAGVAVSLTREAGHRAADDDIHTLGRYCCSIRRPSQAAVR